MTRILYVSTSTTLGGAEKTLYTLATLVDPEKFEVVGIVSLKPLGKYAQRLKAAGLPVYTLGLERRPTLKNLARLAEIVDETAPDVVHALMYQAIQMARIVKRRAPRGFKLVSSPRVNYRTRSFWTLAIDRLLKGSDDLLIAESRASRDYLIKRCGYAPPKVETIYNGIDIAGWPISRLERQQKRLELRLRSGEFLIGTTGRLDDQKGHQFLVSAMGRLKGKPVRCVILGEGPRRAALERQIRKLHLEKQVWLLGEREDVTSWLSALDAFILPSLWEGLPNSLLEAMALGLPVVASKVDGVGEVVSDGKNGLLVPPKAPRALAERIDALSKDSALRTRLGNAAKEDVAEKFNLVGMIAAYEAAYQKIAASTR